MGQHSEIANTDDKTIEVHQLGEHASSPKLLLEASQFAKPRDQSRIGRFVEPTSKQGSKLFEIIAKGCPTRCLI